MTKQYQTTTFDASVLAVPEQVSVAMNESAENMSEGLLALTVGAGLQVDGRVDGRRRGRARPGRAADTTRTGGDAAGRSASRKPNLFRTTSRWREGCIRQVEGQEALVKRAVQGVAARAARCATSPASPCPGC